MLTEIERSRIHLTLNRSLNIPEIPETDTDRRKAGLALVVARYGGDPECSFVLSAADAIEDYTSGVPASFQIANVMKVTGLEKPLAENVMMLIGARRKGFLTWCVEDGGEPVTLPHNLMRNWVQHNFAVQS